MLRLECENVDHIVLTGPIRAGNDLLHLVDRSSRHDHLLRYDGLILQIEIVIHPDVCLNDESADIGGKRSILNLTYRHWKWSVPNVIRLVEEYIAQGNILSIGYF